MLRLLKSVDVQFIKIAILIYKTLQLLQSNGKGGDKFSNCSMNLRQNFKGGKIMDKKLTRKIREGEKNNMDWRIIKCKEQNTKNY